MLVEVARFTEIVASTSVNTKLKICVVVVSKVTEIVLVVIVGLSGRCRVNVVVVVNIPKVGEPRYAVNVVVLCEMVKK